jgi:Spore germination protein
MFVMLLVLFDGCGKNKGNTVTPSGTGTPSPTAIVTLPPEKVTEDDTSGTDGQQTNGKKLLEYIPLQADTEYVYEGKGSEFATYTRTVDYIDATNNKIQVRTNNGGTETVSVIEVKNGAVSVIYKINECYYRDSFMDITLEDKDKEVLLMEPLVKGTAWTLPNGSKRTITAMDVKVDTPSGQYTTIEVTTKGKDGTTKDYYAPKVGLIKSVFGLGDNEISSTLSKVTTDATLTQNINVYYVDENEKMYTKPLKLTFKTNDVTRTVLEKALRQDAVKESYQPLISTNTKINSMYKGTDDIAYVDFSADLTKDMNLGSGFETLVLQCITNTVGDYYGVKKVYLTVAGKPYESGHILMKKGETFLVKTDGAIRK